VETGRLTMTTEYADGKVKVIVDARDSDNKPITDLTIRGGITPPASRDGEPVNPVLSHADLKFEQKNSGVYEAEFKADQDGSYFINARAARTVRKTQDGREVSAEEVDSVRSGVTIPYSPEFADLESNARLLKELSKLTGGQIYEDRDETLVEVARSGTVFRLTGLPPSRHLQPIWYWLLLLTGVCLFFDVAVRRIAIDPSEVVRAAGRGWERLRGQSAGVAETPQFLERLKTRKAQIGEALERSVAARRFEAAETTAGPAPPGAHEMPASPATPQVKPAVPARSDLQPEEEQTDYASRLLKAKQRVWEERDKDKG